MLPLWGYATIQNAHTLRQHVCAMQCNYLACARQARPIGFVPKNNQLFLHHKSNLTIRLR